MNIGPAPSNPFNIQGNDPDPVTPIYEWDEGSVEEDLPFVEEAIRVIDISQDSVQLDKSDSVRTVIRQELEQLNWSYNTWATLKANLLFRNKYLIFDSTYKQAIDKYRIKLAISHGVTLGYKAMKWVPKQRKKKGTEFDILNFLMSKKGLLFIVICLIVLSLFTILFLGTICSWIF